MAPPSLLRLAEATLSGDYPVITGSHFDSSEAEFSSILFSK